LGGGVPPAGGDAGLHGARGWLDAGQNYIAQNAPEVAEQLRKAGVRLAWSLQAALGQPLKETDDS
jgi:hypothetical protein